MLETIPALLCTTTSLAVLLALPAQLRGRRAIATALNGSALAIFAGGVALEIAVGGPANLNAVGLVCLGLVIALAAFSLIEARSATPRRWLFWPVWTLNLALAGGLLYLLVWFKIF